MLSHLKRLFQFHGMDFIFRSICTARLYVGRILILTFSAFSCSSAISQQTTEDRIANFLLNASETLDGLKYEFVLESLTESPSFGVGGRRVYGRHFFWNKGTNSRLDTVTLTLRDETVDPGSRRESSLILNTVAYRFSHSSALPVEKSEIKGGVRSTRRGTEVPDPFTLSTCSSTVAVSPNPKSNFMLDYTVVNEGETEDGRFEAWLLFSDNLSCSRVVFSKEIAWAPEVVDQYFSSDRSPEQRKRKHTLSDLKSWKAEKGVKTKWSEFSTGKYAPSRIRQSADTINGKTVVEYRFRNYSALDKSDKPLLSEESFTPKNIVGAVDFQSIADHFETQE